MGLFIKRKILFHGSGTEGIKSFQKAQESTVGSGFYLTSQADSAAGYTYKRSGESKTPFPIVYECEIMNMKLLNLTDLVNVQKFLEGFRNFLLFKLRDKDLAWYVKGSIERVLRVIEIGWIGTGNLKKVTGSLNYLVTEYCIAEGYDGLIAYEGGEGDYVGNHDSYVIFDPSKVEVIDQRRMS